MLSDAKLPALLRQQVKAELEPGESIRWIEQPVARAFTPTTISICLAGLPGLLIFGYFTYSWWEATALDPELPGRAFRQFNRVGGLLVGSFGLLISCVPLVVPWLHWLGQRQTVYLITNRRALILEGSREIKVRSFDPRQLQDLYRREHSDGTGDIVITTRRWTDREGDSLSEEIGLMNIRNPRAVEQLLKHWDAADPHGENPG